MKKIYGIIWFCLIFTPAFGQNNCNLYKVISGTVKIPIQRDYYYRNYGVSREDQFTEENVYKYHIKCNVKSLHMGLPLSTYITGGDLNHMSEAVSIDFSGSSIPTIPVGVLHSFASVEKLLLSHNFIQSISPGALAGLTNLTDLHLEFNNITVIQDGTFDGPTKLKTLNLSYNNLTFLRSQNGLGRLEILNVQNNHLKLIENDTFKYLTALQSLDLSNNNLVNLSAILFTNTNKMETVLLNNNSIDYIPAGLFNNTKAIKKIDLSNNEIKSVPCNELSGNVYLGFNHITALSSFGPKLTYLNLSSNDVTSIPGLIFNQSIDVQFLFLNNNSISYIHQDSFVGLKNLQSLRLDYNRISDISAGTFRDLISLVLLDMSFNNLQQLEFGFFGGLKKLGTLNLSNNKITALDVIVLFPLQNVKELNLDGNYLRSFDANTLAKYLKSLKNIGLNHNQIRCDWLTDCIHLFQLQKINIEPGNSYKTTNVHGIFCETNQSSNKIELNHVETSTTADDFSTIQDVSTMRNKITTITPINLSNNPNTRLLEKLTTLPFFSTETKQTTKTPKIQTPEYLTPIDVIPKDQRPTAQTPEDQTPKDQTRKTTKTPKNQTTKILQDISPINEKLVLTNQAKYDDLIKRNLDEIISLLICIIILFILVIIIKLVNPFLKIYLLRRNQIDIKRRSNASCAVELLNVSD